MSGKLPLRCRLPMKNERYWLRRAVLRRHHEEPLPVARDDVVLTRDCLNGRDVRLEERRRYSNLRPGARQVRRNSRQAVVRGNVKKLLSVLPPPNLPAAIRRDADFRTWTGKRLNVNLWLTGFVRFERDPFPIWRKLSVSLVIRCPHDRKGRKRFSVHR